MAKGILAHAGAVLLLTSVLVAGCVEAEANAAMQVFNETNSPATIDLIVYDRNGVPVHHDRIGVAARSVAEGVPLSLPAGSYSILARSDTGLEAQQLLTLERDSALNVWLTADGDHLRLAVA